MKGVSEVIAIILILMIVIALAALAYTWFSGIFASMTGTAGTAVTTTTQAMATQFRIESAKYYATGTLTNVTIRNIGTQSFDLSKAVPYVGGLIYSTKGGPSTTTTLTSGSTGIIYNIVAQGAVTCGTTTVTITIETGLTDTRVISC